MVCGKASAVQEAKVRLQMELQTSVSSHNLVIFIRPILSNIILLCAKHVFNAKKLKAWQLCVITSLL